MFLKKMNKGIGPRLIFSVSFLLSISLITVSASVYFILASSLRTSDQNLLLNLRETYVQLYKEGGIQLLQDRVPAEILLIIKDKTGENIFEHYPLYLDNDFEDEDEIRQIKEEIKTTPLKNGWRNILLLSGEEDVDIFQRAEYQFRLLAKDNEWNTLLPIIDNDLFEVFSSQLDNNEWLIIGKSSEQREEHLSQVRYISLIVIIPFVLIGFILSIFLSIKILRPIKDLVQTIIKIKDGKTDLKASIRGTEDEIDILAREFNSLNEKNNILVKNIKETVDNVAHDLRTPMTRFRASAETALSSNHPAELKAALEDAVENSDQILAQLNTIMDVTEAESGTLKLRLEEVFLDRVLSNVLELYTYVADEKNITLMYTPTYTASIKCDIQRMTQAISNVLDNAIKYSEPNTLINVSIITFSNLVEIHIQDQGKGISNEDLPKIWTRLYRGDSSRTTQGLGIGLSLVKAIIEAHQGSIFIQSDEGHGTKVIITLPLCNTHVITR